MRGSEVKRVSAAVLAGALVILLSGAKPEEYTERSLCDLWAGAQCHVTSCEKDAKERCATASRRCAGTSRQVVPKERADRTAACAKAILKGRCGDPIPPECAGAG